MSSDSMNTLITNLKSLCKIDSSIAQQIATKARLEETLVKKQSTFTTAKKSYDELYLQVNGKLTKHKEEEKRLKLESEKLIERRKLLSSFSDYKVQQSAQKEIEQSSKQIGAQEEKLLLAMDELSTVEEQLAALKKDYDKASEEYQKLQSEHEGEVGAVLERINEKQTVRQEAASKIAPGHLSVYEKIRNRHPMDPLAVVQGSNCGGCFMKLGPQMIVQVARGSDLVKCRGCSRILYMENSAGDQPEAGAST